MSDDIYYKLGSIESKQESMESALFKNHDLINKKLDNLFDKVVDMNNGLVESKNRISDLEEIGVDYETNKKRMVMGLIGVGGVAGVGGSGIFGMISTLLGIGK